MLQAIALQFQQQDGHEDVKEPSRAPDPVATPPEQNGTDNPNDNAGSATVYKTLPKKGDEDNFSVAWGSGKQRRTGSGRKTTVATEKRSPVGATANRNITNSATSNRNTSNSNASKRNITNSNLDISGNVASGAIMAEDSVSLRGYGTGGAEVEERDDEADGDDEGWRCPICLARPIAPRLTKCGHGPFCLVCIMRHLKGETSARCPLCFDKIHRQVLFWGVKTKNVPMPFTLSGCACRLYLVRQGPASTEITRLYPHTARAHFYSETSKATTALAKIQYRPQHRCNRCGHLILQNVWSVSTATPL